jgi:Holliday junction resolvasome RuvABC endonuclease subunit
MIAVGLDVSTRRIAIAAVTDEVRRVQVVELDARERGARRYMQARAAVRAAIEHKFRDATVFGVEVPFTPHQNQALMGLAAVSLEAVQAAMPYAVVLDLNTGTWKKDTVGHGNATKDQVAAWALGLGYDGDDQDVCDAIGVAVCARERWLAEIGRACA